MSETMTGNVRATLIDLETGERREWVFGNTMTSGGLALMRNYLLASDAEHAPIPPSYIAVGSGNPAIAPGHFMTTVPGEHFRAQIVQRERPGQSVVFSSFLAPSDAPNQTVSFYGLYAGTAGAAPGVPGAPNGVLFAVARAPVPYNKNQSNSIRLDWTFTVSGVA